MSNSAFSVTGGGGSSGTPLQSYTANNSANVSFTGLSSAYIAYQILCTNVIIASNTANFDMQFNLDSSAVYTYASNYVVNNGTQGIQSFDANATAAILGNYISNLYAFNMSIMLFNPGALANLNFFWDYVLSNSNSNLVAGSGGGLYAGTPPVTSVQLLASTGLITSGNFRLYGLLA